MKRRFWGLWIGLAFLMVLVAGAAAQSAPGYDLHWNTLDNGGVFFSGGGGYSLGSSLGQAEAGGWMSGGDYDLRGGFLAGGVTWYHVELPVILR